MRRNEFVNQRLASHGCSKFMAYCSGQDGSHQRRDRWKVTRTFTVRPANLVGMHQHYQKMRSKLPACGPRWFKSCMSVSQKLLPPLVRVSTACGVSSGAYHACSILSPGAQLDNATLLDISGIKTWLYSWIKCERPLRQPLCDT